MLTSVALPDRHRIGTAEVESALVSHELCAEAAVVGFDHSVKGQVRLQTYHWLCMLHIANELTALHEQLGRCPPPEMRHICCFRQSLGSTVTRSCTLLIELLQPTLYHAENHRELVGCPLNAAQGIYAYCTLNDGVEYTDGLKKELVMAVREQIGAFAAPDVIHWAPGESVFQAGLSNISASHKMEM